MSSDSWGHIFSVANWYDYQAIYLVPIVAILLVIAWMRRRQNWLVALMRASIICLAVLGLMGPFRSETNESKELAVLLDVSRSVPEEARQRMLEDTLSLGRASGEASLNILPFAGNQGAHPVLIPAGSLVGLSDGALASEAERILNLIESDTSLNRSETNILGALKNLASRVGSSSVILGSDGWETIGDVLGQVKRGGLKELRVYPLFAEPALFTQNKLSLASFYAPITVAAEEKFEARLAIRNDEKKAAAVRLEVTADGKKVLSQLVEVQPGKEKLVTSLFPSLEGGIHRLRAVVSSKEGTQILDEGYRWVSVKSKERLLILSGDEDDEVVLSKLLLAKGFALESIVANGKKSIPLTLDEYSAVVFNNIAARQLPQGFLPIVKKFVEGGGGAVLLGGARSFGLGGFIDTPLEEISPLKFVPPQTKKKRLNSAVVLLFDKSRSMNSGGKIDAARRSAYTAIQAMKDEDYVSVIGFDTGPFVIIPMKPVPEAKDVADRRLRNLTAAGQTNLLPALALAEKALADAPTSRKHIILLTDGKFPPYEGDYQNEIASLRQQGVTLSSVALGVEADAPLLKMMSSIGKGAFYHTVDPSQLPEIFIQDIKVTTGENTMKEQGEFPVVVGPGGVVSTSFTRFPVVTGFVETLPKKGSVLELVTRKEEQAQPILASWQFGNGRVIVYTSDASGRWSLPWLRWESFSRFWTEIINKAKKKNLEKDGQLDFDLRYSVVGKSIIADLVVFDDRLQVQAPPEVKAKVEEPAKEVRNIVFEQVRKGRFNGQIDNARAGDYRLDISYGSTKFPPVAFTVPEDAFGEVEGRGLNYTLLSELALGSQGVVNPSGNDIIWKVSSQEKKEYLFSPLLILAMALILLEAFLREGVLGGYLGRLWRRSGDETGRRQGVYNQRKLRRK